MRTTENRRKDGSFTRHVLSLADRLERTEDYDQKGQLTLAVEYRYDDQNRNIERIVRNAAGKQIRRLTFEFKPSVKGAVHREYDENDRLLFTRTEEDA